MSDKTRVYEVWSYFMGSGPTVQDEFGNEADAIAMAESYADESTKTEVALQSLTSPDTYEVVWQSDDNA